jgi:hypothetical protein
MQSLEFEWEDGEVGDFWLRIGLNEKTVHIYQTLWTGQNWWVDAELFGISKMTFPTLTKAMNSAENAVERWFSRAIYVSPTYYDTDYGGGDVSI